MSEQSKPPGDPLKTEAGPAMLSRVACLLACLVRGLVDPAHKPFRTGQCFRLLAPPPDSINQ